MSVELADPPQRLVRPQPAASHLPVPTPAVEPASGFTDIVEFAQAESLPPVDWLSRLSGAEQRVNLHCLPARTRIAKRVMDLVLASTMLVLLAPVMLLTALLVRLTSSGPALFRQTRVGLNLRKPRADRRQQESDPPEETGERRDPEASRRQSHSYGRHFTLYKFRTMRTDAEKHGAQFATKGDPRVTSIGRFLRKTRLDELPQLWNVIKGEMSLVGPRPERPEFIEKLSSQIPDYLARLGLKPGLTGVAQVVNGYDNDIEGFRRKVAFDLLYLQNCSVWNDWKVLLRTIRVVLTGSGAL
jgi:lipopolysaccharide/colanic/teichoic acid biosynthesis glycosyltransferase